MLLAWTTKNRLNIVKTLNVTHVSNSQWRYIYWNYAISSESAGNENPAVFQYFHRHGIWTWVSRCKLLWYKKKYSVIYGWNNISYLHSHRKTINFYEIFGNMKIFSFKLKLTWKHNIIRLRFLVYISWRKNFFDFCYHRSKAKKINM